MFVHLRNPKWHFKSNNSLSKIWIMCSLEQRFRFECGKRRRRERVAVAVAASTSAKRARDSMRCNSFVLHRRWRGWEMPSERKPENKSTRPTIRRKLCGKAERVFRYRPFESRAGDTLVDRRMCQEEEEENGTLSQMTPHSQLCVWVHCLCRSSASAACAACAAWAQRKPHRECSQMTNTNWTGAFDFSAELCAAE